MLSRGNADGTELDVPVTLSLGDHKVTYWGIAITRSRGGMTNGDYVDGVFPAGPDAEHWVYFRIRLRAPES